MSAGSSLPCSLLARHKLQKNRLKNESWEWQNLLLWLFFTPALPVKPSVLLVLNTRVKDDLKNDLIITYLSINLVDRVLPETFWDQSWDSQLPTQWYEISDSTSSKSGWFIYVHKACYSYTNRSYSYRPFQQRNLERKYHAIRKEEGCILQKLIMFNAIFWKLLRYQLESKRLTGL